MIPPSGDKLGLAVDSPARLCWRALRYLHANDKPVYLGKVAVMVNRWLARVNHASLMDDSVRKYAAQSGFANGCYDAAYAAGWEIKYGPQRGQPKGCLFMEPRQSTLNQSEVT